MQKRAQTKKTKHIIIFLISLIYVICPCLGTPWTYPQCSDYLNNLDIICDKIYKADNGDEICEKINFYLILQWKIYRKNALINYINSQ